MSRKIIHSVKVFQFYRVQAFEVKPIDSLNVLIVYWFVSLSISDFVNLGTVYLSFSLAMDLSILLILSKNKLLVSLICFVLFSFLLIDFSLILILIISYLLLLFVCLLPFFFFFFLSRAFKYTFKLLV